MKEYFASGVDADGVSPALVGATKPSIDGSATLYLYLFIVMEQ